MCRNPIALYFFCERPLMDLGRTIINSKCTYLPVKGLDHGVPTDSGPAHHLHASISDTAQGLGYSDLRHRAFRHSERTAIKNARAPVDYELRLLQVNQIVGKHEAYSLVIDHLLSETLSLARIRGRDLVGADGSACPAHAMRETRRTQAHLGVFKPLAALAEHLLCRDAQIADDDLSVTARRGVIHRVDDAFDLNCRIR